MAATPRVEHPERRPGGALHSARVPSRLQAAGPVLEQIARAAQLRVEHFSRLRMPVAT